VGTLIARVPGRKLLTRSYRWARSRLLGGVVVLGYHRVSEDRHDPFTLTIDPESFEAHMRFIALRARPLALRDAVAAVQAGDAPSRGVVVTFDDGYQDTLLQAVPILEQHGIPATVFVTTGHPGGEFWWDELSRLVLEGSGLPGLRLDGPNGAPSWTVAPDSGSSSRDEVLLRFADVLRRLDAEQHALAMQGLRKVADSAGGTPRHRALSEQEIRRLAEAPGIEIGAHTVTHPVLIELPFEAQVSEMRESRATLERISGRPVRSVSYPHGSYSELTRAAVTEAGCDLACCSVTGLATRRSDPLAIPRLWVDHRNEETFTRWMKWWLAA
jgi:peptidoglycan/xylan/chitin deacetylase (PgdA/CDA1 family)